jgi:hypothetical protein
METQKYAPAPTRYREESNPPQPVNLENPLQPFQINPFLNPTQNTHFNPPHLQA